MSDKTISSFSLIINIFSNFKRPCIIRFVCRCCRAFAIWYIYLRTKKFKVGYVPQYGGYFNELTLHDNLKAISEIVIDNKNLRSEKINYLLSKFELENVKEIKAKFLSGGQKKKLVIALSLLSDLKSYY